MPTSIWLHISDVINLVKEINPQSILDIGIGFGKWGFLFREYLDIYGHFDGWKKENWKTKIDGIEIFDKYITPSSDYIYNKIYIGNALKIISDLNKYDLIIMMDVLEHFNKEEGKQLLQKIYNKSKVFILTLPLGDFKYIWKRENKYESHLSAWEVDDLVPPMTLYKTYSFLTTNKQKTITNGVFIYDQRN